MKNILARIVKKPESIFNTSLTWHRRCFHNDFHIGSLFPFKIWDQTSNEGYITSSDKKTRLNYQKITGCPDNKKETSLKKVGSCSIFPEY